MSSIPFFVTRGLLLAAIPFSVDKAAKTQVIDPAQPARLVVDVQTGTGPILHGASGWLYGQSAPGIPTVNIMEPLHPQISAQKPDGGLQHPMADASLVAPDFLAAHGKLMQIYMQDIYPDWTYNDLGIDDYLQKVDAMTRRIVADPNHASFVYVPFNEPNNNWYADNGPKFTKFLHDWMLVYRKIRSIDGGARIAGPGFEHFNGQAFAAFLLFARDNHVLPDEFTWHELHDDFFPNWYRRVDTYRAAETRLGISPLPIVINEYVRDKGDLAVPGNLVQWIARLENSKVYGCLAFWTPSGTLADLTARIWPNRPTGAWWLYQWYGSMRGNTVKVVSPDADAVGLQGVATIDAPAHQVRMIFGGTATPIELNLRGLDTIDAFRKGVHISLSRIASSGIEPSPDPVHLSSVNRPLSGHELRIAVPAASADSAYSLILTPAVSAEPDAPEPAEARPDAPESPGDRKIMAVDSDFDGNALYNLQGGSAVRLNSAAGGSRQSVRFIASAAHDGYYVLRLTDDARRETPLQVNIDDEPARSLILPGKREPAKPEPATPESGWAEQDLQIFLAAGVHRFRYSPAKRGAPVNIHSLALLPVDGPVALYTADARTGAGLRGPLEFKGVRAEVAGTYAMVITYANDGKGHKGQIDAETAITVNGGRAQSTWLRNTFSPSIFATAVVRLHLQAGENRIDFASPTGAATIIQSIQLARDH